jgi:hypothetical protein
MKQRASAYNDLISKYNIDNRSVRIAIEAVVLLSDAQEAALIEILQEEYNITIGDDEA